MSMRRWSGIGGAVFAVTVVVATLAQGAAGRPFGDPAEAGLLDQYLAYYVGNDWIPTMLGFAVPLVWTGLALFAVGLAVVTARGEFGGAGASWALLGILGVTMQNAMFAVVIALDIGQFRIVEESGAMSHAMHYAHDVIFELNSASLALALIGFSAAMRHGNLGPSWIPKVGFTSAALHIVSIPVVGVPAAAGLLGVIGLIGFVLWLVFVAATSLWLLRSGDEAAVGADPVTQST
jgi:hypothetical protein